jgi:hypothetical protein
MKITKRVVDSAGPKAARYILWDGEVKGFGLVVQPSGVKSYIFNYRSPEGRDRRLTLGQHGALTCEQARALAINHRHAVIHGADPLGAKQEKRIAPTVSDILDAYLSSADFTDKAEVTKAVDCGRIERHLRPLLGRKNAHLVDEGDVKRAFAAIRDGKTAVDVKTGPRGRARVRGGEGAARMAIVILSIIFNFAVRSRLMKENPCRFIKLPPVGSRDTILEDASGYTRLFKTLDQMESELRIRSAAARHQAHCPDGVSSWGGGRSALASCRAPPHRASAAGAQARTAHRQAAHHRLDDCSSGDHCASD